jgi:hypothetical protein
MKFRLTAESWHNIIFHYDEEYDLADYFDEDELEELKKNPDELRWQAWERIETDGLVRDFINNAVTIDMEILDEDEDTNR